MEIKDILHEFPYKRWPRSGIHSLRRWNVERSNVDIIYVILRISQFWPHA